MPPGSQLVTKPGGLIHRVTGAVPNLVAKKIHYDYSSNYSKQFEQTMLATKAECECLGFYSRENGLEVAFKVLFLDPAFVMIDR